jgi:hypothetical protein
MLCSPGSSPSIPNEKVREFPKTIDKKVLSSHPGRSARICRRVLVSETVPDEILALSLWETQQDAERYTHEQYPRVKKLISQLVESASVSRTFNVDIFTSYKITAGKLA